MERAYRNVGYVLAFLLPIFIVGFWIPYFSQIPHFDESITTAVHIHAFLLFSFLVLLIVQTARHTLQRLFDTSDSREAR